MNKLGGWRGNQLGGGARKSLKDFAEDDEEDWGDLVAQLSPGKAGKSTTKGGRAASQLEEEEEWEKERSLASRSKSTIVRPTHHDHKRRSTGLKTDPTKKFADTVDNKKKDTKNDDDDWGDLAEQLNKKPSGGGAATTAKTNKDDEEDWDDLAQQLSPGRKGNKSVKKVLQDFAESDEDDDDDWAELGKQLGAGKDNAPTPAKAKGKGKDKSSAVRKLGKFAEGDDDDDWGDLAVQLSPGRRRTSSADPPRTPPSAPFTFASLSPSANLIACVVSCRVARHEAGGRGR